MDIAYVDVDFTISCSDIIIFQLELTKTEGHCFFFYIGHDVI